MKKAVIFAALMMAACSQGEKADGGSTDTIELLCRYQMPGYEETVSYRIDGETIQAKDDGETKWKDACDPTQDVPVLSCNHRVDDAAITITRTQQFRGGDRTDNVTIDRLSGRYRMVQTIPGGSGTSEYAGSCLKATDRAI